MAEAQPLKVNSSLIMFITVTPSYDQSQYNTRMEKREEPLGFDVAEAQLLKVNSSLIIFISFRHVFFLFLFFHSFFFAISCEISTIMNKYPLPIPIPVQSRLSLFISPNFYDRVKFLALRPNYYTIQHMHSQGTLRRQHSSQQ